MVLNKGLEMNWMRQNMLGSPFGKHISGREVTEAEKKVQRCIEKLSIPEWYRNRRVDASNSQVRLKANRFESIETRDASWKTSTPQTSPDTKSRKNDTVSSQQDESFDRSFSSVSEKISFYESESEKLSDATSYRSICLNPLRNHGATRTRTTGNNIYSTYTVFSKTKPLEEPKSSNATKETFDTNLPYIPKRLNRSGTFPRMSPSKKAENINIPLPLPPKLELSVPDFDESKRYAYSITPKKTRFVEESSRNNYKYFGYPEAASTSRYSSSTSNYHSSVVDEPTNYLKSKQQRSSVKNSRDFLAPDQSDFSSPTMEFFTTKNKSTVLQNMVKKKESWKTRSNAVQKMIQAINERSRKSESTFDDSFASISSSCGQNTLVRKFVKALEKGYAKEAREILTEGWEEERKNESESDPMASSFLSTTISILESDFDQSFLPISPKQTRKCICENREEEEEEEEKEEEEEEEEEPVYWISMPNTDSFRCSSVLSMISVLSKVPSPSVSPIGTLSDIPRSSYDSLGSSSSSSKAKSRSQTAITDSGISNASNRSIRSHGSNRFDKSYSPRLSDFEESWCESCQSDSSFDTIEKKIAFFDRRQRAYQSRINRNANKYHKY